MTSIKTSYQYASPPHKWLTLVYEYMDLYAAGDILKAISPTAAGEVSNQLEEKMRKRYETTIIW